MRRLPIDGAACPCPTPAYVCSESENRCVPASTRTSGAAGAGGGEEDAGDVPGATEDGGADTRVTDDGGVDSIADGGTERTESDAHPPGYLLAGDELVVGLTATGRYLVTLAAPKPTATTPRGRLLIRDLATGESPFDSTVLVTLDEVWFDDQEDAILTPSNAWKPGLGFVALARQPDTLSPDGSYFESWTEGAGSIPSRVEIWDTWAGAVSASQPGTGRLSTEVDVGTTPSFETSLVFSPDSRFLYVLTPAGDKTRLARVPTDGFEPVETFESDVIAFPSDPRSLRVAFADDGTLVFPRGGGVSIWRPDDQAPAPLVEEGASADSFLQVVGVAGDTLYVESGTRDPVTQQPKTSTIEGIAISTGARKPVAQAVLEWLTPSPDGLVALATTPDLELFDLGLGAPISQVQPYSACGFKRFGLAFSPDSRWLYGGQTHTGAKGELWLGDAVSIDAHTGARRQLSSAGLAHDPLLVDGDHVVYVQLSSEVLCLDRWTTTNRDVASGDLVVASLSTGDETLVAIGVDEYVAVRGHKVAFTRHDGRGADGVYVLDLP